MKTGLLLLCIFLMLFSKSFAAIAEPDFSRCGKCYSDAYTIIPYLEMAVWLQSLPREEALAWLQKWAKEGKHEEQVIVLCRMLFEARDGEKFRRPLLGGPVFYGAGSTSMYALFREWPLEPITLVDNIPFLIVRGGYVLAGVAESSSDYLAYCVEHTNWSACRYKVADKKQMEIAFEKLVQQFKNPPLDKFEIEALQKQIQ